MDNGKFQRLLFHNLLRNILYLHLLQEEQRAGFNIIGPVGIKFRGVLALQIRGDRIRINVLAVFNFFENIYGLINYWNTHLSTIYIGKSEVKLAWFFDYFKLKIREKLQILEGQKWPKELG